MARTQVVCTTCGQPVSYDDAVLLWEDPDMEESEYECHYCADAQADREYEAEVFGVDMEDYGFDGLDDF
jgi:DNA-directed RNA polymerase subunit RPC12/RpoP